MKQNLSKKTGLKSKNIGQKTTNARQKNVVLEFFFEKTVKKYTVREIETHTKE